jgi:signal-transduction protein with cAMP-binding, CBS, and nucleotidyltransferase domain
MTSPAVTVLRSTPLTVAAARMERRHIHRLVVVADDDPTCPIGILSMTDLVHAIALNPTPGLRGPDTAASAEEVSDGR